jgi:hypothetical protein
MALAAGGCCASRACYAGAGLAALCGLSSVPDSWRQRYSSFDEVEKAAVEVAVNLRG